MGSQRGPIWGLQGTPLARVDPRGLGMPLPNTNTPCESSLKGWVLMSRVQVTSRPPFWGSKMVNLGGRNPPNHRFWALWTALAKRGQSPDRPFEGSKMLVPVILSTYPLFPLW